MWHYISTKYDARKTFQLKSFSPKWEKTIHCYQKEGNKYSCINASQGNNKTIQRHNETQKLCFCVRLDVHKRQKIQAYVVTYLFSLVKCQELCKKDIGKAYFTSQRKMPKDIMAEGISKKRNFVYILLIISVQIVISYNYKFGVLLLVFLYAKHFPFWLLCMHIGPKKA